MDTDRHIPANSNQNQSTNHERPVPRNPSPGLVHLRHGARMRQRAGEQRGQEGNDGGAVVGGQARRRQDV